MQGNICTKHFIIYSSVFACSSFIVWITKQLFVFSFTQLNSYSNAWDLNLYCSTSCTRSATLRDTSWYELTWQAETCQPSGESNCGSTKSWGPKIVGTKKFVWFQKKFESKNILVPNLYWVQKIWGSNILDRREIWVQKQFG